MSYSRRNWFEEWETKKEAREEALAIERQVKMDMAEPVVKKVEMPYKLYECENGQLSFFQPQPAKSRRKALQKLRESETLEDYRLRGDDFEFESE